MGLNGVVPAGVVTGDNLIKLFNIAVIKAMVSLLSTVPLLQQLMQFSRLQETSIPPSLFSSPMVELLSLLARALKIRMKRLPFLELLLGPSTPASWRSIMECL